MPELIKSKNADRTSLDDAILRVLNVLIREGALNVSQAAKATSLHWQTADKVMTLLREISSKLEGKGIDEYDVGKSRMYVIANRIGLDKFSRKARREIIQSYYPEVPEGNRILVRLLLEGASCARMAKELEKTIEIDNLIETSRVKKTKDGRIYLTDLGLRLARGTLKTYSEVL